MAHQKYFPLFVRNQDDEVDILVSSVCLFSGNCRCLCQLKLEGECTRNTKAVGSCGGCEYGELHFSISSCC